LCGLIDGIINPQSSCEGWGFFFLSDEKGEKIASPYAVMNIMMETKANGDHEGYRIRCSAPLPFPENTSRTENRSDERKNDE